MELVVEPSGRKVVPVALRRRLAFCKRWLLGLLSVEAVQWQ